MQSTCIMANEIQLACSLNVSKNGATATGTYSGTITMAGDNLISNVQSVGTSNEAILLGDVTATGMCIFLKNIDVTNYVEIFSDSGNLNLISKLTPGMPCVLFPNAAIYARANTGACNLVVVACEA